MKPARSSWSGEITTVAARRKEGLPRMLLQREEGWEICGEDEHDLNGGFIWGDEEEHHARLHTPVNSFGLDFVHSTDTIESLFEQ